MVNPVKLFTSKKIEFIFLVGICLIGAYLRLRDVTLANLWRDEMTSLSYYNEDFRFSEVLRASLADRFPPIHNIFLWLSFKIFGSSIAAGRGVSVFFGAASSPLFYLVSYEYNKSKLSAYLSVALAALSTFLIFYSKDMRPHASLLFFRWRLITIC